MLPIPIHKTELWDEIKNEFINIKEQTIELEHSLVSISKWEAQWHKPFLTKQQKTYEEQLSYIQCMTVTPHVDPNVYRCINKQTMDQIEAYINNPMTATTIPKQPGGGRGEVLTSELIYYYMFELRIPIECQKWHLNRLITLIKVFNVKNAPQKKMSRQEIMSRNAAINAANKKKFNVKG